ncbi:MAG: radical SAM protein [Verrucomicrobiota bacterium]
MPSGPVNPLPSRITVAADASASGHCLHPKSIANLQPDLIRPRASGVMRARYGPTGVHLFERASGVNILLDEIPVRAEQWSRAPRQVSIALTNTCDLSCPYCYAPKFRSSLNFETLCGWLAELDANGCIGVGFGGGEPTLYPRLVELCQWATANTRMAVTMTSHGHHLDNGLVGALAGNINFMRISMDGIESTYESLRRRPFDDLLGRLRLIRGIVPFGINYVVNEATIGDLARGLALAQEIGATEFLLLPEQAVGGSGGIDAGTRETLRAFVHAYRGQVRLAVSEHASEGLPVCDPLASESGLRAYAHLDAAGMLSASSFAKEGVPVTDDFMSALTQLQTKISP